MIVYRLCLSYYDGCSMVGYLTSRKSEEVMNEMLIVMLIVMNEYIMMEIMGWI